MAETMAQVSDRNREGISGPQGTILIVDDSPALLESLMTLLTEQGYTVHTFLDRNLALKFLESTLPDLVLLGVLKPGTDGYQVCRHLKARECTRDIPIIFLTANTETLDKIVGFRLGAVDYVARPFEAEEVLTRVTTHLALRRQQKQLEAKNIELQESEELHRLTLSSISDAVFLTDDSGAFKFICPNVNAIFGYSVQEVQALSDISKLLGGELFVPAELETLGEIRNVERTITDKAGKAHALLVNVKQVWIREGTQLYTCRDISERKLAEVAQKESEARLRTLIDNLPVEFWAADSDSRVTMQNATSRKDYGDVVGTRIADLNVSVEAKAMLSEQIQRALKGEALRVEGEIVAEDQKRVFSNLVAPVVVDGATIGIVGVTTDVTERRRAEEALHESEVRYRELWKQTQATLAKTEALYRVNRSLMTIADLPSLLQAVVESVVEDLSANRVVLFTTDLTRRQVIREVKGGPGKNYVIDIDFDELWEGLSGWVLREGKPALSPNTGPDPRESPRVQRRRIETKCGSIMTVPLIYQDKILGTMTAINCPDERDFAQDDLELMSAIASQAAIAIENARLHEELQLSYHEMEQRVEERTAELAQANTSLKAEIAERRRVEEALQASVLEKVRLFEAEARRRQEAETLCKVAAVISATTDRSAVLGLILDQLKRVVPYDSASVMLISGDLLDMVAQRGLQAENPFPAPVRLENFPHLGQVLGHRRPLIIADTVVDARWQVLPLTRHIRCWLGVPLVIQDKVIGLLNVDKAQPGFYTERDASLAMAFADYAGISIENTRLFDQIRRRAQDLEALQAISSGLRRAGTREAMQQFVVEKSVAALSGDAGALLLVEGGMMVMKAEYGRSTGLVGCPQPPVNCVHWQAIRTGEPLYTIEGAEGRDPAWQCSICCALMRDMAAGVVIPLKTAETTVGLLHLVFGFQREFSEEKRHVLATIAEIAGSALHRAGILETLEQRVADRTRELAALYDVTAVSSEALDLQTMLERSLERVLKAMHSSTATIHLLDERGETLSLAASQTIAPAGPAEIDFTTPSPHMKEWLIVRGEPLVISDMAASSQTSLVTGTSRSFTYAGAPMRAGGRRLGVLAVARDVDQQFSVEDVALLASIADQVAVAVENARLHQHAEQMAIVEERARLARELHDSVTQCLSSVTLLAQAASDFSQAGEWGRTKHYVERIRDTGGQALKEMRLLLYELQPPSVEQEDLVEMLTRRLDAVEERAGVDVRLLTENWQRVPAPAEEALYRIAQEALNNALKHSGASMVTIVLRGNPEGAVLEVNDNGIGFDLESVKRRGGIGLHSMQQRAERLGGGLTIRSAPGEGTSIKASLGTRQ